jgi:hypothetical protein
VQLELEHTVSRTKRRAEKQKVALVERLTEVAKEGERRVGLVRKQLREAEEAVGDAVLQVRLVCLLRSDPKRSSFASLSPFIVTHTFNVAASVSSSWIHTLNQSINQSINNL